jgi:hypothetical protein
MGKLHSGELVFSAYRSLYLLAYHIVLMTIILFVAVLKGKVFRHSIGLIVGGTGDDGLSSSAHSHNHSAVFNARISGVPVKELAVAGCGADGLSTSANFHDNCAVFNTHNSGVPANELAAAVPDDKNSNASRLLDYHEIMV